MCLALDNRFPWSSLFVKFSQVNNLSHKCEEDSRFPVWLPFFRCYWRSHGKVLGVRTQTIDTNAAYYSHSHDFINWTSAQIWLCSLIAWTSYSRKLLQMTMLLVSKSSIPQRLMNIKLFSRRWGSLSQVLWLWFRISQLVLPTITNYYIMIPIQY